MVDVTTEYGIRRDTIAPSIRAAEALGFVRVTKHGIASNAAFRVLTLFALTRLPTDDDQAAATEELAEGHDPEGS
jgi:hypothetical protein